MPELTRLQILNLPGELLLSWLIRQGYEPAVKGKLKHDGTELYAAMLTLSDGTILAFRGETMQEAVREAAVSVFDARRNPPDPAA